MSTRSKLFRAGLSCAAASRGAVRPGVVGLMVLSAVGAYWALPQGQSNAQSGGTLPTSLSVSHDLDGDGVDDLIVPKPQGHQMLELGEFSSFSRGLTSLLRIDQGEEPDDLFGFGVSTIGDVNGDGVTDTAVGAPGADFYASQGGAVYVLSGLDGSVLFTCGDASAEGGGVGLTVGPAGDTDGDGVPDVLAAGWFFENGAVYGRVWLFSGDGGEVLRTYTSQVGDDGFGFEASGVGDIDGDGLGEIVISAPLSESGVVRPGDPPTVGRLFVYSGEPRGSQPGVVEDRELADAELVVINPDPGPALFGIAVTGATNPDGDQTPSVFVASYNDANSDDVFDSVRFETYELSSGFKSWSYQVEDFIPGGDMNSDLVVDISDVMGVVSQYGEASDPTDPFSADFDASGNVDPGDLGQVLENYEVVSPVLERLPSAAVLVNRWLVLNPTTYGGVPIDPVTGEPMWYWHRVETYPGVIDAATRPLRPMIPGGQTPIYITPEGLNPFSPQTPGPVRPVHPDDRRNCYSYNYAGHPCDCPVGSPGRRNANCNGPGPGPGDPKGPDPELEDADIDTTGCDEPDITASTPIVLPPPGEGSPTQEELEDYVSVIVLIGDPSGSASEAWGMYIGDIFIPSPTGGVLEQEVLVSPGHCYDVQIQWLGSCIEPPDLDYQADMIFNSEVSRPERYFIIKDDPEGLLGSHGESYTDPNGDYNPEETEAKTAQICVAIVDLTADSNRDGVITVEDDEREDVWDAQTGALFVPNLDGDEGRTGMVDGQTVPIGDAISFGSDGRPTDEDYVIGTASDVEDLAPIELTVAGLPDGCQVVLEANKDDLRAMHLYLSRDHTAGPSKWGSATDAVRRTEEYIIAGPGADPATAITIGETHELGLEGLIFATGDAFGSAFGVGGFDGEIMIQLMVRRGSEELGKDSVLMVVAPWLLTPHTQPVEEVFVQDRGAENADVRTKLGATSGTLNEIVPGMASDRWLQDHVEVGYAQRPGAPAMQVALRLPRQSPDPRRPPEAQPWLYRQFVRDGVGLFFAGHYLEDLDTHGDSGNYGGNIEVAPPTAVAPLGRLLIGDTAGSKLLNLFKAQRVSPTQTAQMVGMNDPLSKLSTDWLLVGHIDEILLPTGRGTEIAIVNTQDGWDLIEAAEADAAAQGRSAAMFFEGEEAWGEVLMPAGQVVVGTNQIYLDSSSLVSLGGGAVTESDFPSRFRYLRIYEGPGQGQVAEIDIAQQIGQGILITCKKVWPAPGSALMNSAGTEGMVRLRSSWDLEDQPFFDRARKPTLGSRVVLVNNTKFWYGPLYDPVTGHFAKHFYSPAMVTTREILADIVLKAHNLQDIQANTISPMRIQLAAEGYVVKDRPGLYWGDEYIDRRGQAYFASGAFVPGLSNFQEIGGQTVSPKAFGPRGPGGTDVFEMPIPGIQDSFADGWDTYHRLEGQIHCGSNTQRAPSHEWWLLVQAGP